MYCVQPRATEPDQDWDEIKVGFKLHFCDRLSNLCASHFLICKMELMMSNIIDF